MASSVYLLILLIFTQTNFQVSSSGVLLPEDGYAVNTIIDGNKLHISPFLVLPRLGSSDLIVLDSSSSTFYTISFPSPQEKMVKKIAGSGVAGYADGELGSAMFNKPKSFAVDYKGNLYVADKFNHTIRKISKSGVSTIAGGYSQKAGKADGPAQNASFSDDIELVFSPKMCALIISDHGNKLVRQINLKAEDCLHGSQSVIGQTTAWALGLGLSCLVGLIIGFVLHPYVMSCGGPMLESRSKTWKHCLTSLGRQPLMICFDMRNAIVRSTVYVVSRRLIFLMLSMLSLMLRIKAVEPPQAHRKPVSLLDCDHVRNNDESKSHFDQLKDLISFDEGVLSLALAGAEKDSEQQHKDDEKEKSDRSAVSHSKVDTLIEANLTGFAVQANDDFLAKHLESKVCLVRRR